LRDRGARAARRPGERQPAGRALGRVGRRARGPRSAAAQRLARLRAMTGPMPGRVAFVLKGYPRLSETFIAQEIAALEARGLEILIVSLRHPTDARRHPVHGEIRARLLYLPEYLYQEPLRVLRAWLRERKKSRYAAARKAWLKDLARDPTPNRV